MARKYNPRSKKKLYSRSQVIRRNDEKIQRDTAIKLSSVSSNRRSRKVLIRVC